jgi:hypothetical protein
MFDRDPVNNFFCWLGLLFIVWLIYNGYISAGTIWKILRADI